MGYVERCSGLIELFDNAKDRLRVLCALAVLFALIATMMAGANEWSFVFLDAAAVLLAALAVATFAWQRRARDARPARGLVGPAGGPRVGDCHVLRRKSSATCELPAHAADPSVSALRVEVTCHAPASGSYCIMAIEVAATGPAGARQPIVKLASEAQNGRRGVLESSRGLFYVRDGEIHPLSGQQSDLFDVIPELHVLLARLYPHAAVAGRFVVPETRASLQQLGRNTALFGTTGAVATLIADGSKAGAAERLAAGAFTAADGRTFRDLLAAQGWTLG